jgi:hypothetical protein
VNFEKIKNDLVNKNLKSAAVDVLIYPTKDYVIIPRGRSIEKKWIGAKVLDYKEKGNLNSEEKESFDNKLLAALNVCHDFTNIGILPSDKNVEPTFLLDGRKCNFENYYYITIILFSNTNTIMINCLKPIDKKGSEWVANENESTELVITEADKVYENIIRYVNMLTR